MLIQRNIVTLLVRKYKDFQRLEFFKNIIFVSLSWTVCFFSLQVLALMSLMKSFAESATNLTTVTSVVEKIDALCANDVDPTKVNFLKEQVNYNKIILTAVNF